MEEERKKVQKVAKVLNIASKIIIVVMIILSVTLTAAIISSFFINDEETIQTIKEMSNTQFFTSIIDNIGDEQKEYTKIIIVIGGVSRIALWVIVVIFLAVLGNIFAKIAKGEQPFTRENAKSLFILSLVSLVFIFYNPLVSLILLFVGIFLSHLFNYGAYLNEKTEKTKNIQESMIVSFAEVVENKSEQTGLHVKRVAEYSKVLALELGFSEEESEKIKLASMMHDIGKLLVPSEILEKPARLTDEEFMEIKKHPGYGERLLKDVDGDVLILAKKIAYEHHERFDGRGYPNGLSANNISLESRIVAVADVFDALTSKRSYKEAWNPKDAYDEIVKNSGTQFDAKVVDAFVKSYDKIDNIRLRFVD